MFLSTNTFFIRGSLTKLRKQSFAIQASGLLLMVLFGCSSPPFYNDFECRLAPGNALRLEVFCRTDQPADVYVEYWNENANEHLFSQLSQQSREHHFELIRLLPDEQYRLVLHGRMDDQLFENDAGTFKTDSLPGNLPSFNVLNDGFGFDGYILIKTFIDSGAYMLINDEAQIVWYESYDSIQLRPFYRTKDRHIISLKDHATILEFDFESIFDHRLDIAVNYRNPGAHHEVLKNVAGNYVFLTRETKWVDLRSYGGVENDSIVGDGIMEMSPEGKLIWKWSIFDVADPLGDDDFYKMKGDWGHANSLAYAQDGNLLVSFRDFSQVWKIDRNSGKILWRFGLGGDFILKPEDIFLRQHTAHINDHGDLLIFDNGTAKRSYSSVKAFTIDEGNKTCHATINIKLGKDLFTARMGSGYLIDDEHVLVCSPMKNVTLAIYDMAGNEVWKAEGSMPSYRALYIDAGGIENVRPF